MNVAAHIKERLFRLVVLVGFLLVMSFMPVLCLADYVIIVNRDNKLSGISKEELQRIFLKKEKSFPNGEMIVPVDQRYGRKIREAFYRHIVGKDENELRYYWSKKRFSGDVDPPQTMNNDLEVFYFVAGNKNAIGYVEDTFVNDKVRVVNEFPATR